MSHFYNEYFPCRTEIIFILKTYLSEIQISWASCTLSDNPPWEEAVRCKWEGRERWRWMGLKAVTWLRLDFTPEAKGNHLEFLRKIVTWSDLCFRKINPAENSKISERHEVLEVTVQRRGIRAWTRLVARGQRCQGSFERHSGNSNIKSGNLKLAGEICLSGFVELANTFARNTHRCQYFSFKTNT